MCDEQTDSDFKAMMQRFRDALTEATIALMSRPPTIPASSDPWLAQPPPMPQLRPCDPDETRETRPIPSSLGGLPYP